VRQQLAKQGELLGSSRFFSLVSTGLICNIRYNARQDVVASDGLVTVSVALEAFF